MSNNQISIGFIGAGNMAQAMVRGLLKAGHPPAAISVADPAKEQRKTITDMHNDIVCTDDNDAVAEGCDVLVLAVKPQVMPGVSKPLAQLQRPAGQVIVSVAAGITLDSLATWFGAGTALVRVMPNQPSLVGDGMAGLCASDNVGAPARDMASYVMESTGKIAWFDDEQLLDAVTAISGSGPAYFYLVMEIMQEVAAEFGFDPATARTLSVQTALGASHVATLSDENLVTLRERVTSPGGTTEAALKSLEADGIRDMFRTALGAARDRSAELGKS
jgi:pyrroline-5-carboxylate reductase